MPEIKNGPQPDEGGDFVMGDHVPGDKHVVLKGSQVTPRPGDKVVLYPKKNIASQPPSSAQPPDFKVTGAPARQPGVPFQDAKGEWWVISDGDKVRWRP